MYSKGPEKGDTLCTQAIYTKHPIKKCQTQYTRNLASQPNYKTRNLKDPPNKNP